MTHEGRLAYWKAKAELTHRLFYEQVHDPNQQDEAVENLVRFIRASREVERLTDEEGMEWLYKA
jgi:hypothetical protein